MDTTLPSGNTDVGTPGTTPHVVVVGAGFAGLAVARELSTRTAAAAVRVTLVDQHNYHTFQPLLYQVATAGLNPQDIGASIRGVLRRKRAVRFRLGQVTDVDWDARRLRFDDGSDLGFDFLVLAAGAVTNDFGIEGVAEHAFPLKAIGEAMQLRNHVLTQFERVERHPELVDRGALRFVISGAGPTGVELAGALVELIRVLRAEFRNDLLDRAEVVLVEMLDTVLPPFGEGSQRYTRRWLEDHGVRLELGTPVDHVEADRVVLADGREIETLTPIWVAGVRAHPLADALGLEQATGGRLVVGPDLSVPEHPGVFVVGDLAAGLADPEQWGATDEPELLPQLAPVAIQEGKHVAAQIRRLVAGRRSQPFRYTDKGVMATVGRAAAVAELPGGVRMHGPVAWVAWLILHLWYLIGYRNRLSVLVNWAWNYLTYDQGARLIVGTPGRDTDADRPDAHSPLRRSA